MDEREVLILDARDGYRDITARVESITLKGGLIDVRFKGIDKLFSYSRNSLFFSDKPQEVVQDVEVDGKLVLGVKRKLLFADFLKLFFKTKRSTEVHHGNFKLLEEPLINTLRYFYCVAQCIKALPTEDEEEKKNTLVADGIARIEEIQIDSPLFAYLSGRLPSSSPVNERLIFPFACNASQLDAIEHVFSNRLSLIQGPPGTGKTQTILNILLSAIVNQKRVAVVSNNNSAIRNVVEKLAKKDLDFLVALLGRRENVSEFLEHQKEYPSWIQRKEQVSSEEVTPIQQVLALRTRLKVLFKSQNELKQIQCERDEWLREYERFNLCYPDTQSVEAMAHLAADVLMRCYVRYESIARKGKELWIGHKWWNGVIRKWGTFAFWRCPLAEVLVVLKKTYYEAKFKELDCKIQALEAVLLRENFVSLQQELMEQSWCVLCEYLYTTFGCKKRERPKFNQYTLSSDTLYQEYPIILSTTFMVERFKPTGGFDLLVIDEASQVDVCTGVLALSCARNIVVVGDDKQLPCVVTDEDVKDLKRLHEKYPIRAAYRYQPGQSLLSSLQAVLPDIASVTLREHYRCAPLIIGFCNQKFYDNQLIIHTAKTETPSLHVIFTAEGNHARGHFNLRQHQEAQHLIEQLRNMGYCQEEIGVCTPYRQQADKMNALTVHKFQGREREVMILVTVDNQLSAFVVDDRLVNVAISRAKQAFYLIVSSSNQRWNNSLGDLINYIRYYTDSSETILKGKIVSVFDRLYSAYQASAITTALHKYLFDSPAEELVFNLLEKILKECDVERRYVFKMHIPLRELFKGGDDLSKREMQYLNNRNTHLDFVIYERFGKTPSYAIEVDGYAYHRRGTKQSKRDELKDSILKKRNFPLMRLSTIDSNEEERIRQFLFSR